MTEYLVVEARTDRRAAEMPSERTGTVVEGQRLTLADSPHPGHALLPAVWIAAKGTPAAMPPLEGRTMKASLQRRNRLLGALALELHELDPCESEEELPELDLGLYELEEQP